MLVAVASVKGSPGVTSLAVALAARWPAPGAVMVEADPTGGDLAFRFGRRREPGLSDLAADTRGGGHGRGLGSYAQTIPVGVDVVFAPADEQTTAGEDDGVASRADVRGEVVRVVGMVAGNCLGLLRAEAGDRLVVVDVGRLGWDSPALPLAAAADVLLLVAGCGLEAIDAVQVRRDRLLALPAMAASVRLVLSGTPPCPPGEVAAAVGLPLAGVVAEDRRGAAVLAGRTRAGRGWTRLQLLRAARAIALGLHTEQRQQAVARRSHMQAVLLGQRGETAAGVVRP